MRSFKPVLLFTCLALATSWRLGATTADPDIPHFVAQPYVHPPHAGYLTPEGAIRIVGAQGMEVAFRKLNAAFQTAHPEAKFQMELKGAATAIGGLYLNVSAFAPNVRSFWPAEVTAFRMTFGYEPLAIRVARGAFSAISKANPIAIFVNAKNPIERLTVEQVASIFTSGGPKGDISTWGQVGAAGDWARHKIHPIGPSPTNGNIQGVAIFMKQDHFNNASFAGSYEEALSTVAVLARVAEETSAIGFASYDGFQTKPNSNLKILQIGSGPAGEFSQPVGDDVLSGRYPYTRDIYFYVNRAPGQPMNPFVREYLNLVLSQEGQSALASEDSGFLPLSAATLSAERLKLY